MADDQRTHGESCYLWDRHHYECALREIERLRAEVALFKSELERANALCMEEHGLREFAERELAALRGRFKKAPVGYLNAYPDGYRFLPDTHGTWAQMEQQEESFSTWLGKGKRVRLVRED